MSKTKEKILSKSLELFNKHGLAEVSQRKITEELKISPGNLTYHFKKKEDIETALYFQLVELIDEQLKAISPQEISLQLMVQLTHGMFDCFFAYRFILLDFVHIMRINPTISNHYKALCIQRKGQFAFFFQQLIASDILRKEELPNEYELLYDRFQILSDFWMSSAEVVHAGVTQAHLSKYKTMILQSIYPYLTEKGKEEFVNL